MFETKAPDKILIVKPSSLGDIVHSLPFLNALRRQYPGSEIHWVVARGFESLLEAHPMINRLWIIDKDSWKKIGRVRGTIRELKVLFEKLKSEGFSLVVDLQGLLRSGVITAATGSDVRIGFEEAREGSRLFYTHRVSAAKDLHSVDRYLKIAEFLGCDISEVVFPIPLRFPSSCSIGSEEYAVIAPGARWKTKIWPAENFGKLASLLPLKSVIAGSGSETGIAGEIVRLSNGKVISVAGQTTLRELIEIIRCAEFVVTNDSGPMHIAAALGVPVFAIFGPTDPKRTGPYGRGHTVIREDIGCSPCFKKTCSDMKCMKGLTVEKVYEAILNYPR